MNRTVTLAGYAIILVGLVAMQMVAVRTHRVPTLVEALRTWTRRAPGRVLVIAAWLWLGWHLFARVDAR
jgi:hypothetical protein